MARSQRPRAVANALIVQENPALDWERIPARTAFLIPSAACVRRRSRRRSGPSGIPCASRGLLPGFHPSDASLNHPPPPGLCSVTASHGEAATEVGTVLASIVRRAPRGDTEAFDSLARFVGDQCMTPDAGGSTLAAPYRIQMWPEAFSLQGPTASRVPQPPYAQVDFRLVAAPPGSGSSGQPSVSLIPAPGALTEGFGTLTPIGTTSEVGAAGTVLLDVPGDWWVRIDVPAAGWSGSSSSGASGAGLRSVDAPPTSPWGGRSTPSAGGRRRGPGAGRPARGWCAGT